MFVDIIPEMLIVVKDLKYVCQNCKMIISGYEIKYEKLPLNIVVHGLSPESEIPKCPHCNTLAVLGMQEVKSSDMATQLTEEDEDTITEHIDNLYSISKLNILKSLQ